MQTINIAIECENEHKEAVYALVTSIVNNKNENSVYSIYIVLNGINDEEYIDILKLKNDKIQMFIVNDKAEIFKEIGKIIYFKWNAIVMGDLHQMYELDLEESSIGAVRKLPEQIYNIQLEDEKYDDTVRIIDLQNNTDEYKELPGFYNCCYEDIENNKYMVANKDYMFTIEDNFKIRNSVLIFRLDKNNSPDKYFDGALSELWMHYYKISPLGDLPIRRQSYIETIGGAEIETTNSIPVLLEIEDNDAPFVVAQIMSMLENVSAERHLDIRIVYKQLSKFHKDMLLELSKNNERISITLYSMQLVFDINQKGTFELLISLIFTEYDKAIYIRKGKICKGNIAEMYDMDMQGYLLAVYEKKLESQTNKGTFYIDMPELDLDVAVVNVKEWNKREIFEKIHNQMSSNNYSLNDVFGIIYRKEIKIIPVTDMWCTRIDSPEEYKELSDKYIANSLFAERLLKELEEQEERESYKMNEFLERIEKLEKDNARLKEENKGLTCKNREIKEERDRFLYEIQETRKSVTYRIGRLITYLPRKIRGDR